MDLHFFQTAVGTQLRDGYTQPAAPPPIHPPERSYAYPAALAGQYPHAYGANPFAYGHFQGAPPPGPGHPQELYAQPYQPVPAPFPHAPPPPGFVPTHPPAPVPTNPNHSSKKAAPSRRSKNNPFNAHDLFQIVHVANETGLVKADYGTKTDTLKAFGDRLRAQGIAGSNNTFKEKVQELINFHTVSLRVSFVFRLKWGLIRCSGP